MQYADVRDSNDTGHGVLRRCAESLKNALTDPRRVCESLSLFGGQHERARGWSSHGGLVRCPWHEERTPSCSVFVRGGLIGVRCHGCAATGDVLSLIAQVHGMHVRRDFRDVLCEAATMAGMLQLIETIRGRSDYVPREPPKRPEPLEVTDYPDADEVARLWESAVPLGLDDECASYFATKRGLDPNQLHELVRAMVTAPPRWGRYQGSGWLDVGFRAVSRVYDATGSPRSVRAWRVTDGDGPKRLPPAGYRTSGLVLANPRGVHMLRERALYRRVLIAEGEPDWATLSVLYPSDAVLGVYSGSWTPELADRIPIGSSVVVRTHTDDAGERYARGIVKALEKRAAIRRMR